MNSKNLLKFVPLALLVVAALGSFAAEKFVRTNDDSSSFNVSCQATKIGRPLTVNQTPVYPIGIPLTVVTAVVLNFFMTMVNLRVRGPWKMEKDGPTPPEKNFFFSFFVGAALTAYSSFFISRDVIGPYHSPNFLAVCHPDAELMDWACNKSPTGYAEITCKLKEAPSPQAELDFMEVLRVARFSCPSTWVAVWAFMMATVTLWAGRREVSWPWGTPTARVRARYVIQLVAIVLAASAAMVIYFSNLGDWVAVTAGLALGGAIAWFIFEIVLIDLLGWKDFPETLPRHWDDNGGAAVEQVQQQKTPAV